MLQQALADLRRAYINFFERRARFPKFKKKKAAWQSFRIPQRVRMEEGCGLRQERILRLKAGECQRIAF
jgi:transposase